MAEQNATRNGARYRDIWILVGVLLGGVGTGVGGVGLWSTNERFFKSDAIRLEDRLTEQIRDLRIQVDRIEGETYRIAGLLPALSTTDTDRELEQRIRTIEIRIGEAEDK